MVDIKHSESQEEITESFKIENTIYDMINKVMEDNNSLDSFHFEEEDLKETTFQIDRNSTRHQTSTPSNFININRGNKRNLTDIFNNHHHSQHLKTTFSSNINNLVRNPSFGFKDNLKDSSSKDLLFFNKNINQSFQIPESHLNNCLNLNKNYIPELKENEPSNQEDFIVNSQHTHNINNLIANKNNITNNIFIWNNANNPFFSLNIEKDFKRGKKRNKTNILPEKSNSNIANILISSNTTVDGINNKNSINNDLIINDGFIFKLKTYLEKTGKIDYYIYNLIKGNFLKVIQNHKGSKLFQKYFKLNVPEEIIHLLYLELRNNLEQFITDPYANYFCKKFYKFLNISDRIEFLNKIKDSIVRYSCDSIGTYPLQTIIENMSSNIEKNIIILSIKDHIERLVYDSFGSHVIEKIITYIDEEDIPFLYSYISDNFLKMAYNINGICIIKKILSFTEKIHLQNKIKKIIVDNAFELIQHSYGNFVVQKVVEYWKDYKSIINLYKNHFFGLSMDKYASNVMERFIEKDEGILSDFINEIIKSNKIFEIMKSNYGNYVIQKALKLSKNVNKKKLIFASWQQINNLGDIKLIIKWKSILLLHFNELNQEEIEKLKIKVF